MQTLFKAQTVISNPHAQCHGMKPGQWVVFTAGPLVPDYLRNKRGQFMGFDQWGKPVVNLAALRGTPSHKATNWKHQFSSNKGLRMFTLERNGVQA
jgi:hypothetical protein